MKIVNGIFLSFSIGYAIVYTSLRPSDNPYYNDYGIFPFLSDCGKQYAMDNFELVTTNSHYPANENEIAISDYTASVIISDSTLNYTKPDNLINQNIRLYGHSTFGEFKKDMKITAVYKVNNIPDKYDSLKQKKTSDVSEIEREELTKEFKNFISNGLFLTGFVSENFYDANTTAFIPNTSNNIPQIPNVSLRGFHLNTLLVL